MFTGLNHLTLAVADLAVSVHFYQHTLGLRLHARWTDGAYLSAGTLWLCLSLEPQRPAGAQSDYTHYALSIAQHEFAGFVARMGAAGVVPWKRNASEGASFYFQDPDGHRLEAHVGDLAQRLAACRAAPYAQMELFD